MVELEFIVIKANEPDHAGTIFPEEMLKKSVEDFRAVSEGFYYSEERKALMFKGTSEELVEVLGRIAREYKRAYKITVDKDGRYDIEPI